MVDVDIELLTLGVPDLDQLRPAVVEHRQFPYSAGAVVTFLCNGWDNPDVVLNEWTGRTQASTVKRHDDE